MCERERAREVKGREGGRRKEEEREGGREGGKERVGGMQGEGHRYARFTCGLVSANACFSLVRAQGAQ